MNLLLTGCFTYSKEQLNMLQMLGYNLYFIQQENAPLPLPAFEIDATVCNGLFLFQNIDEFTRLKFVQLTSAGFDRVPVDKIKERSIQLYNARGVYNIPMAEWVLFRVLEHYKKGWFFKQEQTTGRWTKHRGLCEIAGKKVAIIGAGNIGKEVAKHFHSFYPEITGFDIYTETTLYFDKMIHISSLLKRIEEYDIIVITAPLLPTTKGLISRSVLSKMKENAVLVNIARGGLIDEQAMCDILLQRPDLFAALDVFEIEPLPKDSPLWKMKNVAISPHNSFIGNGNNERMFNGLYNNLKTFIAEKK